MTKAGHAANGTQADALENALQHVLQRLDGVKQSTTREYSARCPAHDDRRQSLSVGKKNGKIVVCCHAGCATEAVLSAIGLRLRDLFADSVSSSANGTQSPIAHRSNGVETRPRLVKTYDYTDADGRLLYQVCRFEPKTFRQRRRGAGGEWVWNLNGASTVLYRLPLVIEALAADKRVFVVEGEKDADALIDRGQVATTSPMGAGKWRDQCAEVFRNAADVVILPDNDEAGRKHATDVFESLERVGANVRIVDLPNLPPKGDVSDWLGLGRTTDDLTTIVERAAVTTRTTLSDVQSVFTKWLHLPDTLPLYAVLGAIAANHLEGDPVWLGLLAPPSSTKTEIINSLTRLPNLHMVATITPAGLLSGTSKREKAANAKGGLLKEVGDFGILVMKDFTSVLSMRPEAKTETLAALREIYDGSWTRRVGTDGGQSLSWTGKLGLVFGVTPALDSHHAVIGAMGERFLLCRIPPAGREQAVRALKHAGAKTATMRDEISESVARLFAGPRREPRPLEERERDHLITLAALAVRIRSTVERDRQSREIESIHGEEGPARLVLSLERLLAGLDSLGCERALALKVVERVALDSVPPLRRRALDAVRASGCPVETKVVAEAMGLPTVTARRVLEDLAAYRLVERENLGPGRADTWAVGEVEWPG